jgi:chromosome segregation ATPase
MDLAAVVKKMADPTPELLRELDVLRKKADAASSARDEAKPRSQRARELRGKHQEVQGKLDKNRDRLKQQETLVAKLKDDLAKAENAYDELVKIIDHQHQKVRELHTRLGAMSDSGSEEESSDDDDMGKRTEGEQDRLRGVVGRHGKVSHTTDEARLASLLSVRPGTGAAATLREDRRAPWGELSADDGNGSRRDGRSRSPPQ